MNESGIFKYEYLKKWDEEIRLLTVSSTEQKDARGLKVQRGQDGDDDALMSLELKHYRLAAVAHQPGGYNAVSYAWGKSESGDHAAVSKNVILVNGKPFSVRENAYRFLRHYRFQQQQRQLRRREKHKDRTQEQEDDVPFWMDAICIDQNNADEKNWQVAMMDRIFACAQKVLIWLGSYSESGEALVEPYHRYLKAEYDCNAPRSLAKLFTKTKAAWTERAIRIRSSSKEDERQAAIAVLRPLVSDLLLAEYWERLWIVQEVILGQSSFIVAGSTRIDFMHMYDLVGFDATQSPNAPFVMHLWGSRMGTVHQQPIADLLDVCKAQKCFDYRDRIYGLLGLSTDLKGLVVDYEACPEILFANVIRRLIHNEPDRTNVMIKESAIFARALGVTSQSMARALQESKQDQRILTLRDISIEMTCQYMLQLLDCSKDKPYPDCPQNLSRLYELDEQHITLPFWSDDQDRRCFEKSWPDPGKIKILSDLSSSSHSALLCTVTWIPGTYILTTAAEAGSFRIRQAFSSDGRDQTVDNDQAVDIDAILPQKYLEGFKVQAETGCTFSARVSPADLVLLHEYYNSPPSLEDVQQPGTASTSELLDFLSKPVPILT